VPYGLHDKLTEGGGRNNNGSTTNDRTKFSRSCRQTNLESALGWKPIAWDPAGQLDYCQAQCQRDGRLKNERRQSTIINPMAASARFMRRRSSKKHPYSWPVIGSMVDLKRCGQRTMLKRFLPALLTPNNATLAVVGDFDAAQAKQWIAKYFSDLPQGKPVQTTDSAAGKARCRKAPGYEDRVQTPASVYRMAHGRREAR